MLQFDAMARENRRYTTVDGSKDWIVSVEWDPSAVDSTHWFEARVLVTDEVSGQALALPKELAVYRIGEIEHPLREIVAIDWDGDREGALSHMRSTIYRRIYAFIERGH